MLISVTPVDGEHRMLINTDDIVTITKQSRYYHPNIYDTMITLRDGAKFRVEESINTLEARITP